MKHCRATSSCIFYFTIRLTETAKTFKNKNVCYRSVTLTNTQFKEDLRCFPLVSEFDYSSRCQILSLVKSLFRVAYSPGHDVIHKPEIHNVSQRRQRSTGPRPSVDNIHKSFGEDCICRSGDMLADRQTDEQTKTLITILCFPTGGGVITTF